MYIHDLNKALQTLPSYIFLKRLPVHMLEQFRRLTHSWITIKKKKTTPGLKNVNSHLSKISIQASNASVQHWLSETHSGVTAKTEACTFNRASCCRNNWHSELKECNCGKRQTNNSTAALEGQLKPWTKNWLFQHLMTVVTWILDITILTKSKLST